MSPELAKELLKQLRPLDLSIALQLYGSSPLAVLPAEKELCTEEAKVFWLYCFTSFAVGQNHSGLFLSDRYHLSDLFPQAFFSREIDLNLHAFASDLLGELPDTLIYDEETQILYFPKWNALEKELADLFYKFSARLPLPESTEARALFSECFPASQLQENPWQAVACFAAMQNQLTFITGGPGTGKTTTVVKIVLMLLQLPEEQRPKKIHMIAPTGKAADRMKEAFDNSLDTLLSRNTVTKVDALRQRLNESLEDAQTIQRFIEQRKDGSIRYGKERRLPSDWVIVDEGSMVNMTLFTNLFRALPDTARITILGDHNQLSAVETGNVLADLTRVAGLSKSKEFADDFREWAGVALPNSSESKNGSDPIDFVTKLLVSYRFQENSPVARVANLLLSEERLPTTSEQVTELCFFEDGWKDELCDLFAEYRRVLTSGSVEECLQALAEIRVLCAVRKGEYGVDAINRLIADYVLGARVEDLQPQKGLPIMITENAPAIDLWNGDCGVFFPDQEGTLQAYFGDTKSDKKLAAHSIYSLPQWELSFASTVHKSQGSEYQSVAFILPPALPYYVSWELVYTAVTRAKKQIQLFLEKSDQGKILYRAQRYSGLGQRFYKKLLG